MKLLADLRLAVEVEDELPVETIDDPESFLARCAALNPVMDPFARKMAARGLALGVAAVAALSVSGVAAAVNGDPLSPYEKVIEKVVDAVRPQTSFPKEQLDGMPVVDKTKIVKVAKDYKQKAGQQKAAADEKQIQNGSDSAGRRCCVRRTAGRAAAGAADRSPSSRRSRSVEPTDPQPTKLTGEDGRHQDGRPDHDGADGPDDDGADDPAHRPSRRPRPPRSRPTRRPPRNRRRPTPTDRPDHAGGGPATGETGNTGETGTGNTGDTGTGDNEGETSDPGGTTTARRATPGPDRRHGPVRDRPVRHGPAGSDQTGTGQPPVTTSRPATYR